MKFSYEMKEVNKNTLLIDLIGSLDEDADLPKKVDADQWSYIQFNFDKVDFLNSSGIKKWMFLIESLGSNQNLKIEFHNCKPFVIEQLNLILGFLPENGEVKSLFIPLYCNKCGLSFNIPKKIEQVTDEKVDLIYYLKKLDCDLFPTCKKYLELDTDLDSFLKFLEK